METNGARLLEHAARKWKPDFAQAGVARQHKRVSRPDAPAAPTRNHGVPETAGTRAPEGASLFRPRLHQRHEFVIGLGHVDVDRDEQIARRAFLAL